MKIRTKLHIVAACSAALVLAIALGASALYAEARRANATAAFAESVAQHIIEQRIVADEYLLYGEDRAKRQWELKQRDIMALLDEARTVTDFEETALMSSLVEHHADATQLFEAIVENRARVDAESAVARELEKRLAGQLLIKTQTAVADAFALSRANRAHAVRDNMIALAMSAGAIAVLALVMGTLMSFFRAAVVAPLAKLQEGTRIIAQGNLRHRVALAQRDEIGELAASFDTMTEKLQDSMRSLRREHEATVAERNKLAVVIAGVRDAVMALDASGAIVLSNPAAEELTGYAGKELLGKPLAPLIDAAAPEIGGTGEERGDRISIRTKNGAARTATIARGAVSGSEVAEIVTLHDLTRELEAERAKSQFITVAAHQIRTPLTGIRWALTGLQQATFGRITKKQRDVIDQAVLTSDVLMEMTDDLLGASEAQFHLFRYAIEPHDLNALVRHLVESLHLEFEKKSIVPALALAPELPPVMFDTTKLRIALINLLENAIHYTNQGGSVIISTRVDGDRAIVTVEDTGVGIPKSEQDKVFTKFFRAPNAVRTKPDGTGLGLYLVHDIVQGHGGEITFHSEEGKGTVFSIALKIAPRDSA